MLACENEIKCIEIVSPIIKKSILKRVKVLEDANNPILSFHEYRVVADIKESLIVDKNKIFKSLMYLAFVLLLYPLVFLGQLIFNSFFNSKMKSDNKSRIQQLLKSTHTNYEVSENKSFLQLWSDKGLRDYGLGYMENGPYSYEDKFYCLSEWVKILHDDKFDLKILETEIHKKQVERANYRSKNNPSVRITLANPIDLIPFEIDKIFGNYNVGNEHTRQN